MSAPLKIYVIWHPNNRHGTGLAETLQEHFLRKAMDPETMPTPRLYGMGIPIELRSLPGAGRHGGLPLDITASEDEMTFIVALVDQNLHRDAPWVDWLRELASRDGHVFIPAYLGSLELDFYEAVLPIWLNETPGPKDHNTLRRRLTITCGAYLNDDCAPPQVFFSYHGRGEGDGKRGKEIADRLGASIGEQHAGLRSFLAHRDLYTTQKYEDTIRKKWLGSEVMIAVFTGSYPHRVWCRREAMWSRQPRAVEATPNCWRVTPLVIVDALTEGGWSDVIHEFGGSPILRWKDGSELELEVIDRALIEAVISLFHTRWAQQLATNGDLAINWIPDASTLAHLRGQGALQPGAAVRYPGYGLLETQQEWLEKSFRVSLLPFEEC